MPVYGMVLAHLGVAVALAGMSAESAFIQERLAAMRVGQTVHVGKWQATLVDVRPVAGPNWTALEAVLRVSSGNDMVMMRPQSRNFTNPIAETNEAALHTTFGGQFYAVLGQGVGADRWQLRLWWKPLVWWIWAGGWMIAIGGMMALVGRLQPLAQFRRWRARRAPPPGRYA